MRSPRQAMCLAIVAVVSMATARSQAQSVGSAPSTGAASPASTANPALNAMSGARSARHLLTNGRDYVEYGEYERALSFLREAESRQRELSDAERQQLQSAIQQAQAGMRSSDQSGLVTAPPRRGSARQAGGIAVRPPSSLTLPSPFASPAGSTQDQAVLPAATQLGSVPAASTRPVPAHAATPITSQPAPTLPATPTSAEPPVASAPITAPPVATRPVAAPPLASAPIMAPPVATRPIAAPPVASAPIMAPPVATRPVAAPPVETPKMSAAPEPKHDVYELPPLPTGVATPPEPPGRPALESVPTETLPPSLPEPEAEAAAPEPFVLPELPAAYRAPASPGVDTVVVPVAMPPQEADTQPQSSPSPTIALEPMSRPASEPLVDPLPEAPAPPVSERIQTLPIAAEESSPILDVPPGLNPTAVSVEPYLGAAEQPPAEEMPVAIEPAPVEAMVQGAIEAPAPEAPPTVAAAPLQEPIPGNEEIDQLPPPAEELTDRGELETPAPAPAIVETVEAPAPRPAMATASGPIRSDLAPAGDIRRRVEEIARRQDTDIQQQIEELGRSPQLTSPDYSARMGDVDSIAGLDQSESRIKLPRPPSSTQPRPIRAVPVPEDYSEFTPRQWAPSRKVWASAATCHGPLYFQDAPLERYGQSVEQAIGPAGRYASYPIDNPRESKLRNQLLQPFYSIGKFATQIAVLPYNLVVDPPWEAEYDLGYYRPGDRIPPDTIYAPLHGVGTPLQGRRY